MEHRVSIVIGLNTWYINLLRCRPLRRTCSAYRSTSQPFSARNCRRENSLLGKRTFPKFFAFFAFVLVTFFYLVSPPVFSFHVCFTFFQLRERVLLFVVRFGFPCLYPQKLAFHLFLFGRFFFLSFFRFSFFVTSDERTRLGSSSISSCCTTTNRNNTATPLPQQQEARACVFV